MRILALKRARAELIGSTNPRDQQRSKALDDEIESLHTNTTLWNERKCVIPSF
jgi:hypothetical protein